MGDIETKLDLLLEMYAEDRQKTPTTAVAAVVTTTANVSNSVSSMMKKSDSNKKFSDSLLLPPSYDDLPEKPAVIRKSILTKKISDSGTYVRPSSKRVSSETKFLLPTPLDTINDQQQSNGEKVHFYLPSRLSEPNITSPVYEADETIKSP